MLLPARLHSPIYFVNGVRKSLESWYRSGGMIFHTIISIVEWPWSPIESELCLAYRMTMQPFILMVFVVLLCLWQSSCLFWFMWVSEVSHLFEYVKFFKKFASINIEVSEFCFSDQWHHGLDILFYLVNFTVVGGLNVFWEIMVPPALCTPPSFIVSFR